MIHFETNSVNVPEQVSTFYVTWCNACWNLFPSPFAHKFQLKVSTWNGGFNSSSTSLRETLHSASHQLVSDITLKIRKGSGNYNDSWREFPYFVCVLYFLFAWFLFYLRVFFFICVFYFLFAWFPFYLRGFFYVCSVSLVGHRKIEHY